MAPVRAGHQARPYTQSLDGPALNLCRLKIFAIRVLEKLYTKKQERTDSRNTRRNTQAISRELKLLQ